MERYIVGARNNSTFNFCIELQTNCYLFASFMAFLTKPFVNEIEIVESKNVRIVKKPTIFEDGEYEHI